MVGRPRIDEDLRLAIEDLARRGKTNVEILDALAGNERFADRLPKLPTVKKYAGLARRRSGEPWRLQASAIEPADERRLLDVVSAVFAASDGRVTYVTEAEASWLATILRVSHPIDEWTAFLLARDAVAAGEHGGEVVQTALLRRLAIVREHLSDGTRFERLSDLDESDGPAEGDQR